MIHLQINGVYRVKLIGFILLILLYPVALITWFVLALLPVLEMYESNHLYFLPLYFLGLYWVNKKAVSPLLNLYIKFLKLRSKQLGID